jgi:hypothetical protein
MSPLIATATATATATVGLATALLSPGTARALDTGWPDSGPEVKGLPGVDGFLDPGPRLVRALDKLFVAVAVHLEATPQ